MISQTILNLIYKFLKMTYLNVTILLFMIKVKEYKLHIFYKLLLTFADKIFKNILILT